MIAHAQQLFEKIGAQDLGVGNLPDEMKKLILARFGEVLLKRVTLSILDRLPRAEHQTINTFIRNKQEKELDEFLRMRIKNLDQVVAQAVEGEIKTFKEKMGI